jgi:hypothetical protein
VPYFQDNLDEVLSFEGIRNFTGGQASGLQSDLLGENQVQQLYNMTLSPKGNLETRVGTSSFATGATSGTGSIGGMRYYETGSTSQLLTVTNGRFYSINSSGSATIHPADSTWIANTSLFGTSTQKWASGYSIGSAVEVSMAQFNNKMYIADADGDLHYWDGDVVIRQGGKVRAITITSGGTGYTSATAIVTGPQWGGQFPTLTTVVNSASGVISEIIVNDGGYGYSGAPTVTIIGNGSGATATATVSPPPQNLRLLINTENRLFAVGSGDTRNTLYASDILDPAVWDASNSIVVNGDDGDQITAIVPYYKNRIIVFKKRRVFQVDIPSDATTAADWVVSIISNNTGCVAAGTAVQVSSDILFLSDNGIRSLVRSVADDFSSVGVPISEVIKDVIQSINTDSIRISTAIYYDNRYFLAVPTGSNNVNDTLIVYNTVLGAFEGTWSPKVMQFTLTNFNQAGTRAMFKKVNGVIEQYAGYKSPAGTVSSDYQDAGANYDSYVRTKDFNFGDTFAAKYGSHFEVIFDDSFSNSANIFIQRDVDTGDISVQSGLNIASSVLTLDFALPAVLPTSVKKRIASDLRKYEKWRLLNIKISSTANKMAIRQIVAAANPDTIEIQKVI